MPLTKPDEKLVKLNGRKITRFLPANVSSSDTDVAGMKITGTQSLTIGRSYLLELKAQVAVASNSSFRVLAQNGAQVLVEVQGGTPAESGSDRHTTQAIKTFIATGTEIIVSFEEFPSAVFEGSGGSAGSWISVTELPYDIDEVASF